MIGNKLLTASILTGALLVTVGTVQAANTVMFDQEIYTVMPDETFTVGLDGMDFGRLDAGGLNVSWDPTVLELTPGVDHVVIDPTWEFFPTEGDTSTGGEINGLLFNTLSFDQPSGNLQIADISFHVVGGVGDSTLLMLSESGLNRFSGPDGMDGLNFMASTVNVVPEMEVWAMMIAGMGFLGWQAKRRSERDDSDALPA